MMRGQPTADGVTCEAVAVPVCATGATDGMPYVCRPHDVGAVGRASPHRERHRSCIGSLPEQCAHERIGSSRQVQVAPVPGVRPPVLLARMGRQVRECQHVSSEGVDLHAHRVGRVREVLSTDGCGVEAVS